MIKEKQWWALLCEQLYYIQRLAQALPFRRVKQVNTRGLSVNANKKLTKDEPEMVKNIPRARMLQH